MTETKRKAYPPEVLAALERERKRNDERRRINEDARRDKQVLVENKAALEEQGHADIDALQVSYVKDYEHYMALVTEADAVKDRCKATKAEIADKEAWLKEHGIRPYRGRIKLPPLSALGIVDRRKSLAYAAQDE